MLIPTATRQEIHQYSDVMLKHLLKISLKVVQHDLLYSQKSVILSNNLDRRLHYDLTDTKTSQSSVAADANFKDRETKIRNQLKNKDVH